MEDNETLLRELDAAYEELRAARERLTESVPGGESRARTRQRVAVSRINPEAWEQAESALDHAHRMVAAAHRELLARRLSGMRA